MARRSDHSREEIHEMALQAAETILTEEGFAALSARRIAAAMGYTVGTLYLVFKNLDDLILQLNGRTLDELYNHLSRVGGGHGPGLAGSRALGAAYLGFATENKHRFSMIFEHRMPSIDDLPDWYLEKIGRMFSLVEQNLRPLADERSEQEIALAARALWSGVHGIVILARTGRLKVIGGGSVEEMIDSLVLNYLEGFRQPIAP
jgi:AcrR family transcriptional regulator